MWQTKGTERVDIRQNAGIWEHTHVYIYINQLPENDQEEKQ